MFYINKKYKQILFLCLLLTIVCFTHNLSANDSFRMHDFDDNQKYQFSELSNSKVVTPELFGAKGDGITDDAAAINKALASSSYVKLGKHKTYQINSKLYLLRSGITLDLNQSRLVMNGKYIQNCKQGEVTHGYQGHGNLTIKNGTIEHGEICIAHASNIKIENINFKNSDGHFIQIMSCSDVLISDCSFKGIRTFQKDGVTRTKSSSCECINLDPCSYRAFGLYGIDSPSYDGTNNNRITIQKCISEQGTEEGYTAPQRLGFSHYHVSDDLYHDNITVKNNVVYGSDGMCCMRFYDFHNSNIYNNLLQPKFEKVIVKKYGYNNQFTDNTVVFIN